ncbi:MAG: HAD-IIB family hydrolase [Alphaproteobacteria bacterium]|nr:HAD-IIB family hydrolase [Alphaproteobacteria bacterium]
MISRKFENCVFLSDMDGTLTPSRQSMTPEFEKDFNELITDTHFYIVTGSDIEKIKEQIPENVMKKLTGIFASMGNEFYVNGERISKNEFIPEESLIKKLEDYVENTRYPYPLFPNHIEKRCGMVNFCVVGRECPLEERFRYQNWDKENGERKSIAIELAKIYPQYSFEIGGAISIDIVPNGFGKVQVADKLREMYQREKIIFFGDRTEQGGNDYEVAERLLELGNSEIVTVQEPNDVLEYLKATE